MRGKLTRVIHVRGFGFLEDENGQERFVGVTDFIDQREWPTLQSGQTLEFEPRVRDRGKRNNLGIGRARVVSA